MAPSPTQLLIVAFIILLLFGTTRLSELGKGLGEGIRNFKKGIQDEPEEEKSAKADDEPAPRKNRLPPRKASAEDAETQEEEADERA